MTNQRLDYLDSIRGIAAMTTLVGHWLHMFKPDQGMPERTRSGSISPYAVPMGSPCFLC